MTLATVDSLNGIAWSSKGAAGDALQRVPHDKPFMAVWLNDKGEMCYAKANTDAQSLALFSALMMEFAQSCLRENL